MEKIVKKLMDGAAGKHCRVRPDTRVDLDRADTDGGGILGLDKDDEKDISSKLRKELLRLQALLYAEHKHKVLVVLQAMDTAGKDGVIQHVFSGVNPQGVKVASFKAPSHKELDRDYLWRVHQEVPAKGEMTIFNRSHYEDVLVTRVHRMIEPEVWKRRYRQIAEFERMLAEEGTVILKFYLHISKKEQKKRLDERREDPLKNWKFSADDLEERKSWSDYMRAYEDAIGKTSSAWAPWHIIPSDRKWLRNLLVLSILVHQLRQLSMEYPSAKK